MSEEWRQSEEELQAQVSDDSPIHVLEAWIAGVRESREWPRAMMLMTPELRLACAQRYLTSAGISDQRLAESLAAGNLAEPHFRQFSQLFLAVMDALFAGWPEEVSQSGRLRPLDIDHELLVVRPRDQLKGSERDVEGVGRVIDVRAEDLADVEARGFPMRRDSDAIGGWLVAGWNGDRLPQPGWPPQL